MVSNCVCLLNKLLGCGVNLRLSDGKLRLRGRRLLRLVYFALLQLVFRILDLRDR